MSKWKKVPLESVTAPGKGQIVSGPFGSNISSKYFVEQGVPVIRGNNLTLGREQFVDDGFVFLTSNKASELKNCVAISGDILFTAAGTIGQVGLIPEKTTYPFYIISNKQIRVRLDISKVSPKFIYYWLSSPLMTSEIRNRNSGSTIPLINLSVVRQLTVPLPPLPIQRRIASILSAYDDLIENNRRRITLLEKAARLLYEEWFIRLRFPGHEHTPITAGLPQGWERRKLADVCQTIGGGTPSTQVAEYWDGDVLWVTPTDVTRNNSLIILDSEKKISQVGLKNSSAKLVPPDTILMTSRATIGAFALIDREVSTNQGFISVIPNQEEARMFLLFNLISRKDEMENRASGTIFKEISKKTFRDLDVIMPPIDLLKTFNEQAYTVIKQVRLLKKSIEKLQSARDLLLPRLLSGELEVSSVNQSIPELVP